MVVGAYVRAHRRRGRYAGGYAGSDRPSSLLAGIIQFVYCAVMMCVCGGLCAAGWILAFQMPEVIVIVYWSICSILLLVAIWFLAEGLCLTLPPIKEPR